MRTILISGASRGIGYEIAKHSLRDGHRISIGVRDPSDLIGTDLEVNESNQDRLFISTYNANNPQQAKDWVSKTINKYGEFDSIINCAGIFKRTPFNFSTGREREVKELIETNIMGPWFLMKESWKYLLKTNEARIIVLVSMSGVRSKGSLAGYTVSKFGLMGLCQTIRNEGWEHGLRVTAICPSWVNTTMAEGLKDITKEDITQPKDLASIISLLLKLPNSCIPFELKVNCNLEI